MQIKGYAKKEKTIKQLRKDLQKLLDRIDFLREDHLRNGQYDELIQNKDYADMISAAVNLAKQIENRYLRSNKYV